VGSSILSQTEHFDSKKVAAMRIREHVLKDEKFSVHHEDTHVAAAWIDEIRYPPEEE
jgi:hypothetical protein